MTVKEITQKMREEIPDTIRINKVKQYLKEDKNLTFDYNG